MGYESNKKIAVNLRDGQNLQLLRQKILRTLSVLDQSLDVAQGCVLSCQNLVELGVIVKGGSSLAEIGFYMSQIRRHRIELQRILKHSSGTVNLVSTSTFTGERST